MFAKAPLKRFNEEAGCAPPVTKYSPRFQTDMSIKSEKRRGCHFYKSDRFRQPETSCGSNTGRKQIPTQLTERLRAHFMNNLASTYSSSIDFESREQLQLGLTHNPAECTISQPIIERAHQQDDEMTDDLRTIHGNSMIDRKKLDHLENVLTERDTLINQLQTKNLECSQRLEAMSRLLESEQSKLILLKEQLKTQNCHMADMEKRLKEVREELEVKLEVKNQLLGEALRDTDDWQRRYQQKNEEYQKTHQRLDAHLAAMEQEKADLRAVETKLRYAAVALETMSADTQSWRANSEMDRQNLEKLQNHLTVKNAKIRHLENEMVGRSREVDNLGKLVQAERSKVITMEEELARKNFKLQKLMKASQQLKDHYDHRLLEKDQLLEKSAAKVDVWRILYESKNQDFEIVQKNLDAHRSALDNIRSKLDKSFHLKRSDSTQFTQSTDLRDTRRKLESVSNQLLSSAEHMAAADKKFERIRAQIQRHLSRDQLCEIWRKNAETGKHNELEDLLKFEKKISIQILPTIENDSVDTLKLSNSSFLDPSVPVHSSGDGENCRTN